MGRLLDLNTAGQTLIQVTHSPDLAARYAKRAVRQLDRRIASDTTATGGIPGSRERPGAGARLCAREPALEGTLDEPGYERASTLTRPGSPLHSTTVRPWSSTSRGRELVS